MKKNDIPDAENNLMKGMMSEACRKQYLLQTFLDRL